MVFKQQCLDEYHNQDHRFMPLNIKRPWPKININDLVSVQSMSDKKNLGLRAISSIG